MEFHRIQNAIELFGPPKPEEAEKTSNGEMSPSNGETSAVPGTSGERTDGAAEANPASINLARRAEMAKSLPSAPGTPTKDGLASSSQAKPNPATDSGKAEQRSEVQAGGTLPARPPLVPRSVLFEAVSAVAQKLEQVTLPGVVEPKLAIGWGEFRQGVASSFAALFRGPFGRGPRDEDGRPITCPCLRDTCVERRVPVRAVIAAGLWHVAILALPISLFTGLPHRNPAFQNVEVTWRGPIDDLPLLEIPREQPKLRPQVEAPKPLPPVPEAFHPRQRIFTDPVRPTHPRQTLINPVAPNIAPKLLRPLPNMVLLQEAAQPAKPRMQITDEMLKQRPRETRAATDSQLQSAPNMERQIAEVNLPTTQAGPARPKLEIKLGAAPHVAQRTQSGDAGPAPDMGATQLSSANGGQQALIALSAHPAAPAPVEPPQGNLAAHVSISPEGGKSGETSGNSGSSNGGKSTVGVSISGGNASATAAGNGAAKISAPAPRVLITRPDHKASEDVEERTSPPDFAALPPGAKPETIFASRKVYTLNVNMPNLNSSTGSWILSFSEFHTSDRPRMATNDLSGPVPVRKVDPKYPPTAISERIEGEVVLYAVIRRDGSVDSIQLVRGIDKELDANAMKALAQWQFRPASKQGAAVELEAIVHIPFRLPEYQ